MYENGIDWPFKDVDQSRFWRMCNTFEKRMWAIGVWCRLNRDFLDNQE